MRLACLCLAAGCGSGPRNVDGPAPVSIIEPVDIRTILPPETAFSGIRTEAEPKVYAGQELSKYDPKKSDLYHAYGFARLAARTYVRDRDGTKFRVAVYDMVQPINAFGVLSRRRNAKAKVVKIGEEGQVYRSVLEFHKGDYFVRVAAEAYSATNDALVLNIGDGIASRVPASAGEPVAERLAVLPSGYEPQSTAYYGRGAFGHAFLQDAVEARYAVRARRLGRLFCARLESENDAHAAMKKLREAYQEQGVRSPPPALKLGQGAFEAEEDFYGRVVFFQVGPYVAGMFQAGRGEKTRALLQGLFRALHGRLKPGSRK